MGLSAGVSLPDGIYETLVSVWRSRGGHRAPGSREDSGRLSQDEMYAVSRRIRELSRGFTRERSLAGERYLGDPELLGAYLLHYWPISFCQAALCLQMMRKTRGEAPLGSALDVGAGPGPISLALHDAGARSITASDRSGVALGLARRIADDRGCSLSTRQWDALSSTGMPQGPFDVIALAHTLNELWAGHPERISLRTSLLLRLGEQLAPQGRLLVIEPALMQTAQEAIRVRDGLARAGYIVEMPCIWQADCPALPDATCHGEFEWSPPPDMVRLSHMARIGRESLKMAWFVLRKGAPKPAATSPATSSDHGPGPSPDQSPDGGTYRVVSEPLLSKSGRIRYLVCGALGRFALSAPKGSPGTGVKPFYTLKRGEGIRFAGARKRESGWGFDEHSRIEVVERLPKAKERVGSDPHAFPR